MHPVLIEIGGLRLGSYGAMLALAFIVADILFRRELIRRGLDTKLAAPIFVAAVLGGVVGMKLIVPLEYWPQFVADPVGVLFSTQGYSAYGGFILATGLCAWIIRRSRQPVGPVFDAAAPALMLAYGIGRIGCQLAGDGCYGIPSDLPWAMSFPDGIVPTDRRVHPAPVYEFIWSLIAFAALWRARTGLQSRPFALFCLFLLLAGSGRFLVEFIRLNPEVWAGFTSSQLLAAVMIVAGGGYFLRSSPLRHRVGRQRDGG